MLSKAFYATEGKCQGRKLPSYAFAPPPIDKSKSGVYFLVNKEDKMRRKRAFALILLVMGMGFLGCVLPFYGTAKIEPGLHFDVGLAGMTYGVPSSSYYDEDVYYPFAGGRADFEVRYGVLENVSLSARFGAGLGTEFYIYSEPFIDGALGVQLVVPVEGPVTPALRTEFSGYLIEPTLSPAILLGIGREEEKLTLGTRIHLRRGPEDLNVGGLDAFVGIHLSPQWTIFAGAEVSSFFSSHPTFFTLGVGYGILE